jgi:hypothetical protein
VFPFGVIAIYLILTYAAAQVHPLLLGIMILIPVLGVLSSLLIAGSGPVLDSTGAPLRRPDPEIAARTMIGMMEHNREMETRREASYAEDRRRRAEGWTGGQSLAADMAGELGWTAAEEAEHAQLFDEAMALAFASGRAGTPPEE